MKYFYGKYIQDGKLDSSCGRIVIYNGFVKIDRTQSADHNYLLRSLAANIMEDKNKVIADAIRLYFKREAERIIISPVRKIDDDEIRRHYSYYADLIKRNLK